MAVQAEIAPYTTRERASVLISTLLAYWLDFYNILIIAFLIPSLQKTLGITLSQAAGLASATLVASAVGGVLFGWFGDKYGRKPALLWTLGIYSIGGLLSAFSWNYAALLIFRTIAGIGIGGEWGIGMTLYNEVWTPKRRGVGSAVIQSMAFLGIALSAVVSGWSLASFDGSWGWRVALLVGASPIVLMLYVRLAMPESRLWEQYDAMRKEGTLPEQKRRQLASWIEVLRGESLSRTLRGLVLLVGYMFSFYTISLFIPTYMGRLGAPASVVSNASLLVAMLSIPLMIMIGLLSDITGRRSAMILGGVVTVVGFAGIAFATQASQFAGSIWSWPLTWWYLVWSAGVANAAIFGPWLSELYPVETRSTATSSIYMIGRGASAAATPAVAAVAAGAGGNLALGMFVGVIGAVALIVVAVTLPETAGRAFRVIEEKHVA